MARVNTSFPSWSDLKDNVPVLTSTDTFERWDKAIRTYCLGKGILSHIKGFVLDPYLVRDNNDDPNNLLIYEEDYIAGIAAPTGQDIERDALHDLMEEALGPGALPAEIAEAMDHANEDVILSEEMFNKWNRWARSERLARTVLLLTIHDDLSLDYDTLPNARHIYLAVESRFRTDNPEKIALLQRELHSLYLKRSSTADETSKFYQEYVRVYAALARLNVRLSEEDKVANLLTAIPTEYSIMLRAQWASEPNKTWSRFTAVYATFVESLRATEERETVATNGAAAAAAAKLNLEKKEKPQQRSQRRGKSKSSDPVKPSNGKPKLVCVNHPNATSHKTEDCRLQPKVASSREVADGYYNASSASKITPSTESSSTTAFLVDSGATHHIVGNRDLLVDVKDTGTPIKIQLAGTKYVLSVTEIGRIVFLDNQQQHHSISHVLYSPDTTDNMLSATALTKDGWKVTNNNMTKGNDVIPLTNTYIGGRLATNLTLVRQGHISASDKSPKTLLHRLHLRYGHLGKPTLLRAVRNNLIPDVNLNDVKDDTFTMASCESCLAHKTANLPRRGPSDRGNAATREYVHVDIKSMSHPTTRRHLYWLAFVSDFVGYRLAIPLTNKSDATARIKTEIAALERQANVKVTVIRSDRGGEFKSGELAQWCRKKGIKHQLAPVDDQALNGVAERHNRTVSEMVRTLLKDTGISHDHWDHATWYVNRLLNMTTMFDDKITVYERYSGRKPHLERFMPFGAKVFARIPAETALPTLSRPRSRPARILSTSLELPGWTVLFDNGRIANVYDVFEVKDGSEGVQLVPFATIGDIETNIDEREGEDDVTATSEHNAATLDLLDDEENDQALPAASALAQDGETAYLASLAAEAIVLGDPVTVKEALAGPDRQSWIEAMQAELDNLNGKGTWTGSELPRGRVPITAKWVFKRKTNADGSIAKYKARLVARGFAQVPGVDFEDTFAPVSRLASLRILLAHAATHDLELRQIDVEGAYLNGPLNEEIYLAPPPGVEVKHGNTLRLNKALYGLKQSGRAWWLELDKALRTIGFKRCASEWGLHSKMSKNGPILLLAYVDDILIVSHTKEQATAVVAALRAHWALTDMGEPKQMLSIRIDRDRANRTIRLSSTAYIEQIATQYNLMTTRVGKTTPLPGSGEHKDLLANENNVLNAHEHSTYRELIGKTLWLAMSTRLDLAFASSILSQVLRSPSQKALELARRTLAHAYHTKEASLVLGGKAEDHLKAYVDADFAGDLETRRSTTGYAVLLYGSTISWAARRQGSVATSTTAAEYVAIAEVTKEIIWLRQLLLQLHIAKDTLTEPVKVLVDNQAAITIAERPANFPLSKHIDVRHHFVREQVERGKIALEYVPTGEQHADCFTKALAGPLHTLHTTALGIKNPANVLNKP